MILTLQLFLEFIEPGIRNIQFLNDKPLDIGNGNNMEIVRLIPKDIPNHTN